MFGSDLGPGVNKYIVEVDNESHSWVHVAYFRLSGVWYRGRNSVAVFDEVMLKKCRILIENGSSD